MFFALTEGLLLHQLMRNYHFNLVKNILEPINYNMIVEQDNSGITVSFPQESNSKMLYMFFAL